jgi:aspartyl-tRNA(Asn)/glutamyl-tRNA(Gln) amidotransferase subunit C
MAISKETVEHVAKLARLALSEDEKTLYTEQLAKIIGYFDELKNVDTTGIEPMANALPLTNVMREDEIKTPPGSQTMLKSAPEVEQTKDGNYFRVPKIGD